MSTSNLRRISERFGYREVARLVGETDRVTIARWACGRGTPSPDQQQKIDALAEATAKADQAFGNQVKAHNWLTSRNISCPTSPFESIRQGKVKEVANALKHLNLGVC